MAHVSPCKDVVGPLLQTLDDRILEDDVREIEVERVLDEGEDKLDGAGVSTKLNELLDGGDLIVSSVDDLLVDGVDVELGGLDEAALGAFAGSSASTFPEAGSRQHVSILKGTAICQGKTHLRSVSPTLNSVLKVFGFLSACIMIWAAFLVPSMFSRRPPSSVRSSKAKSQLMKSQQFRRWS